MDNKTIGDITYYSILKDNLYLNGIIVSDRLFKMLNGSQYYGYRTTTGIFMKLGGTLSKKEFEKMRSSKKLDTLFLRIDKGLSYEEYLKIREYTTTRLKKASEIDNSKLKDTTYFILDADKNGRLYIVGQYVSKGVKYPIKIEDCGFFKQKQYADEAVALQAGGIRLRDSICGDNCISGCKFCDFGKDSENYVDGTFDDEKENYITGLIKKLTQKGKTKTLFITGGNPSLADMKNWTRFLEESIHTFKSIVPDGIVDVMLTPRGFDKYIYDTNRYEEYREYLEYLKSIGVNTISPNMELWSQDNLDKFCGVSKSKNNIGTTKSEIGHNGYLDFIRAGIDIFGKYNVRTSLIVGLNSNEDIKKAIDLLIPLGCYVVLSPFIAPNNQLNEFEPKDYDLIELSNYLKQVTDKTLHSIPVELAETYKKRISGSLNAHNSHNTANLCCGQELDFLEQQVLNIGRDKDIVNSVGEDREL